jgi:poly-gamma-glutamate synthesis protein (capsule biosynthesis protein)
LAFAGDTHFQLHLAALLDRPRGALGPITRTLSEADVTMVNLESAITRRGTPEPKEYVFRTSPAALALLDTAGVDVVSMANNHAADYGQVGLEDTLRAVRNSRIPVLGIGRNQRAAFDPYRVTVRGTDVAFFAADGSPRETASNVWAAGPRTPGVAAARAARPSLLLDAVRAADERDDVVVVYMHWGREYQSCPSARQQITARSLAAAGADVIVGSHAHVLLASGWLGETYVNYGLGNFLWYHDREPDTGVLQLRIRAGAVVADDWIPARIQTFGRPLPLTGMQRTAAIADWRRLRDCADLAPLPGSDTPLLGRSESSTTYSASVRRIGPELRARMRFSHRPGCPVPLNDLRYLRMSYVGFDGHVNRGAMVVHEQFAKQVTGVFRRLYDARWPIQQMRLVDDFRGDDDRSMAANNTSGYNCRRIAGTNVWSDHAHGAAIDINPVQNPYVTGSSAQPPAGRRLAAIDRSVHASVPVGAIRARDVVVRSFARIGWDWGGTWSRSKDYQHFSAPAD